LITRDTVIGDTPARRATSRMVTVGALIRCYQYHTYHPEFIPSGLTLGATICYR
jgi:hypothetical protein